LYIKHFELLDFDNHKTEIAKKLTFEPLLTAAPRTGRVYRHPTRLHVHPTTSLAFAYKMITKFRKLITFRRSRDEKFKIQKLGSMNMEEFNSRIIRFNINNGHERHSES